MHFMDLIIFAVFSFFFTRLLVPVFIKLFSEAGFIRPNFRGEYIPLGIGVVFYIASAFVITLGRLIDMVGNEAYVFLFAAGAMALFGLIDDIFGTRQASGLAGHFKKLVYQREFTTGALKAIAGGTLALVVSVELNETGNLIDYILDALVIALSTNLVNLLDLRPGRAGKGFFMIAFFIMVIAGGRENLLFIAIFSGTLIAFLPLDLRARAMMGDAGSNTLGFVLGYTAVSSLDLTAKVIYLLILAGVHVITERFSLTRIIEKNRVLNYIDLIGRK